MMTEKPDGRIHIHRAELMTKEKFIEYMTIKKPSKEIWTKEEIEEQELLDSIKDLEEGRCTSVSSEESDEEFLRKLNEPNKEEILDGTINLEITSDGIIFLVTSKLNNYTSKKVKIPKESAKALRSFLIEIYR